MVCRCQEGKGHRRQLLNGCCRQRHQGTWGGLSPDRWEPHRVLALIRESNQPVTSSPAGRIITATFARQVFCGNAGDSKAILFNPDPADASRPTNKVVLNNRHGAELKSERARIKAAGGTISPDGAVYGVLYPTRGFGDIDVKSDGKPVIIATPDGAGIDKWQPAILDTSRTTYLILASDGLWDFAEDNNIMSIALRQVGMPVVVARLCCHWMALLSLARGSFTRPNEPFYLSFSRAVCLRACVSAGPAASTYREANCVCLDSGGPHGRQ